MAAEVSLKTVLKGASLEETERVWALLRGYATWLEERFKPVAKSYTNIGAVYTFDRVLDAEIFHDTLVSNRGMPFRVSLSVKRYE